MTMKPTIFVGSSTEGKKVAKKLVTSLKSVADCTIWSDTFALNESGYDSLLSQLAFYDYAILVATSDDITISRKRRSGSPRDNVLFEFGLFAGGLGRNRVFFLVEEKMKILSDLAGITLPTLKTSSPNSLKKSIRESVVKIEKHIALNENSFDFGFLPSATLAYGYFINFVERTIVRLLEDKAEGRVFNVNEKEFKIVVLKFTVLVPNDLSSDMFTKVKAKRLKDGWSKLRVDPKDVRDYDFAIDVSEADKGTMHLVDIPLTLNALNKSIELFSKKEHIKKSVKENLIERREIRNFRSTLEYLIAQNPMTKNIVSVELIDV